MPRLRNWNLNTPGDYWAWLDWRSRVAAHQQMGWLYQWAQLPPAVRYQNAIDVHWKMRRYRKDKFYCGFYLHDTQPWPEFIDLYRMWWRLGRSLLNKGD